MALGPGCLGSPSPSVDRLTGCSVSSVDISSGSVLRCAYRVAARDRAQLRTVSNVESRAKGLESRAKTQGTRVKAQGAYDKGLRTRGKGQGARGMAQGTRGKGQGTTDSCSPPIASTSDKGHAQVTSDPGDSGGTPWCVVRGIPTAYSQEE